MKRKKRLILIITIAVLILGMAFFPKIQKKIFSKDKNDSPLISSEAKSSSGKPLNIVAQVLQYTSLNDLVYTTGSLMPDEEVDLSFETSGKITKIYFQEGTLVKKGDLLAKVNDEPLQAELKKLQAQLPLANDRVFRQKSLLERDAVSLEAYEQVTTDLEKLKADLELIKSRISQTELRAPFDGVIGLRLVSEGTYASPTTVIARLTKISPLKLEFSINERQANQIRPGIPVAFRIQGDLNEYNATVYAMESAIDMRTRTLKVRASYPNAGGKLKPGISAAISIRMKQIDNTLTVPNQAVIAEMGRDIVYIYKDGIARQVALSKGIRTESQLQVLKGLDAGDTLIVTGIMQLRDGMPVKIDKIIDPVN